jgi:hypothetical protein
VVAPYGVVDAVTVSKGATNLGATAGRNVNRFPVMLITLVLEDAFGFLIVDSLDVPDSPGLLYGEEAEEAGLAGEIAAIHLDNLHQQHFDEAQVVARIASLTLERIGCTVNGILGAAEEESGVKITAITTRSVVAAHVVRYRNRLINRLLSAYEGADRGDIELVVPDPIATREHTIAIDATQLAVFEVEARKISDATWESVNVVGRFDAEGVEDPRILLRDKNVVLLSASTVWSGVYDRVRLLGAGPLEAAQISWTQDLLSPNELLAPIFCRCLELEGALFLASKSKNYGVAAFLKADREANEAALWAQATSNVRAETWRRG